MLRLEAPMSINLKPPIAFQFDWRTDTYIKVRINLSNFLINVLISFCCQFNTKQIYNILAKLFTFSDDHIKMLEKFK